MSDYREAYREELEDTAECPIHPGSRMRPAAGIPCTMCEDGDPPTMPDTERVEALVNNLRNNEPEEEE